MADWTEVPEAPVPELSIVVPCRNEMANLAKFHQTVCQILPDERIEFIFVDDASTDATSAVISALALQDVRVRSVRLMINAGQQAALRAGLRLSRGHFVVTMDADLEHPPENLPKMLLHARQGHDVVQMVRKGQQPGIIKDWTSRMYYKVFNALAETPIPPGAADFRLLSNRVVKVVNALPERKIFLRALLPQLGFKTHYIDYRPGPPREGAPPFTFAKSLRMGIEALFSNSTAPLRWAIQAGSLVAAAAFAYGLFNVGAKFFSDSNVPGYTDVIASVLFLGGVILLYLGLLGRYLVVILDYLRSRPEYVVELPFPRKTSAELSAEFAAKARRLVGNPD